MRPARSSRAPEEVPPRPAELVVDLDSYQGPMDLLLELIRAHEVDVCTIPLHVITERYLAYIDAMQSLDLQIGGEWLEMASTLLLIKSRELLPKPNEEAEPDDGPDPREELLRKIQEYAIYKAAAGRLGELPTLGDDVFVRPSRRELWQRELGPPPLRSASLADLVRALARVVDRSEPEETEWAVEIRRDRIALRTVLLEIVDVLREKPRVRFEDLFAHHAGTRHRVVTTFFALLEMARLSMIRLFQSELAEQGLWIERAVIDVDEVNGTLDLPRIA